METPDRHGTAIVFPGMGPTPFANVAKFMLINAHARELLATADEVLGYRLTDRYQSAAGDYSPAGQLAFVVNCLAMARWAEDVLGIRPRLVAGPSFGGRAAAVYSGVLGFADAVVMTARLADMMDEYFAAEHPELVTQSMARLPEAKLAELRAELDGQGEFNDLACQVDDDFVMLTVREGILEDLQRRIRSLGGMPLYTMKPPMHSHLFAALGERVDAELFAGLTWSDPALPVVADQDGRLLTTGDEVRRMLVDGFTRTVRWPVVRAALAAQDIGTLHVAGEDRLFTRVTGTTRAFLVVPVTPQLVMRPVRRQLPSTVNA
ncbi:Malonyl CoA-acyl carrier protein transacylase [Streptomyces sp. RB5]|uniref:[acyl-carrier-protein] S-malonyltransferase n=1 Tax=Streptomyces smaragdinus TaxID=2585196 RepID=A0A7K0CM48_9ACTN|nr:ACP S-malonyltransferase [Streptomyces smaragdinus]MQY14092.1 Malonyl CoA-acyl carrier protein transacylase [Streptomyces smaragdinus]